MIRYGIIRPNLRPLRPPIRQPQLKRNFLNLSWRNSKEKPTLNVLRVFTYTTAIFGTGTFLTWYMAHEFLERDFPSPNEWSYRSRIAWHSAHVLQDPLASPNGVAEWGAVAGALDKLLIRLEDENIDGYGLVAVSFSFPEEEAESLARLNLTTSYDISQKPEPWRRGYVEALLSAASTADKLEGMVKDRTTHRMWPKQYVVGASNDDPTLLPAEQETNQPKEENCVLIAPRAGRYYEKLLATEGLDDQQTITAQIAYGEWLDSVGLHKLAHSQLQSALDLALGAIPNPSQITDKRTFVLKSGATALTQNILGTTTAMGVHFASSGQAVSALPIFLSLLRAYGSIPIQVQSKQPSLPFSPSIDLWGLIWSRVKQYAAVVRYPAPETTGNEPLVSRNGDVNCAEAAMKVYAAEVLFATSPSKRHTALRWTKEAVNSSHQRSVDVNVDSQEQVKCAKCAVIGLENWESMLFNMVSNSQSVSAKKSSKDKNISWESEQQDCVDANRLVQIADVQRRVEDGKLKIWGFVPKWIFFIF